MKALRRFLALMLMATAVCVWTGCDEDDDPTMGTAPFLGGAWAPASGSFTNGAAAVSTGF